ncbi:MAG: LysR family transcriptional regulator [Proteobacteria bacterium]|nr:LysR family transcriptional regulator [Pseudomonadota bacterium]
MIDELRSLAIFAKVVEISSFRQAAKDLKLSPSVVSHHVAQLEERLGVILLYRSTRKLSLTSDGEKLYSSAKAMLSAAENGLNSIAYNVSSPTGKLKLALPALLSKSTLLKDIAEFAKHFPKVSISINFSDLQQDLIQESIDLAIRIGNLKDSTLKSKKLFELKRTLVVSPAYLANQAKPKGPLDLKTWDWIGLNMRAHSRTLFNSAGKSINIDFTPRIVADSVEAVCQLAIAGLGLATPPLYLAQEEIKKEHLVHPLKHWTLESLPVYAVWPPNVPKASLVFRLIEFLENRKKSYF